MKLPHWCPAGYVPVSRILHVIIDWSRQGVAFKNLPDFDTLSASRFQERLGRALAYAELPANGVSVSGGGLVCVPPGAWVIRHPQGTHPDTDQFALALTGDPIFTKISAGEQCLPIVRLLDLAIWGGLSPAAEPPEITPEDKIGADAAKRGSQVERPAAQPSAPLERGGRRFSHDWDAFWIEVCHWVSLNVDREGFKPEYRDELQQHMERWTADNPSNGKHQMDVATVRKRLRMLEKRLTQPY